jgi:hypothetical protein
MKKGKTILLYFQIKTYKPTKITNKMKVEINHTR